VTTGPWVKEADNVIEEQCMDEEQLTVATASPNGNPRRSTTGSVHDGQVRRQLPDAVVEEGGR
jgi:hypothetical protein